MRENTLQYFKRESTLPLEKSRLMWKKEIATYLRRKDTLFHEQRRKDIFPQEKMYFIYASKGLKLQNSNLDNKVTSPKKKKVPFLGRKGGKEGSSRLEERWNDTVIPIYPPLSAMNNTWKGPPVRLPSQIFKSVEEFSSIFSPTHPPPPPGQLMHPSTRPALENR